MPLSREEVQHIATLCRVALSEEELERMRTQLSNILEQFEVLKEVDTRGVPPTGHSVALESVMRDDILANAPRREGDFFLVNAVLEE